MRGFNTFIGTLVSLLATLTSVVVAAYFVQTFWYGNAVDFNLQVNTQKIPPESYPILLLTGWTLFQRGKAHWRPSSGGYGKFWSWEDLIEAFAMAIFLGVTLFYALAANANLTFILVLIAFLVQAIGDAVFNGRHRYEEVSGSLASDTAGRADGDVAEVSAPYKLVAERHPTEHRRTGS